LSVDFGVKLLEPGLNNCIKAGTDFHSHLPLLCHFRSPKGLKARKVLSLKKLEMADPPQRTNLGEKKTRLSIFSAQRTQSRKLAVCVHRGEDAQCVGARECTSRAKSAYVRSITWPHLSLRASCFSCRGEITMIVQLT